MDKILHAPLALPPGASPAAGNLVRSLTAVAVVMDKILHAPLALPPGASPAAGNLIRSLTAVAVVMDKVLHAPLALPPGASPAAENLIRSLLNRQSGQRPTAGQLLQDAWLVEQGAALAAQEHIIIQRLRHVSHSASALCFSCHMEAALHKMGALKARYHPVSVPCTPLCVCLVLLMLPHAIRRLHCIRCDVLSMSLSDA